MIVFQGISVPGLRAVYKYADTPETRRYLDGLRKAGMPE